jgi:hypothetical protein
MYLPTQLRIYLETYAIQTAGLFLDPARPEAGFSQKNKLYIPNPSFLFK